MPLHKRIKTLAAHRELRRIVLYLIIGSTGAALDVAVFSFLLWCGVYYLLATLCSSAVATLFSFLVNRRINFNVLDNQHRRMVLFFVAGCLGYSVSALTMWVLVSKCSVNPLYAKIASLFFIFGVQYPFNRFITFRTVSVKP